MPCRMLNVRTLVAVGVVLAVVSGSGLVYAFVTYLPSQNQPQISPPAYSTPIAHVLGVTGESSISALTPTIVGVTTLTIVGASQTGYGAGTSPYGSNGLPNPYVRTNDTGHLQLVLRKATLSNGSMAVVETLTNIGQVNVTIGRATIGGVANTGVGNNQTGAAVFNSYVVGCTRNTTTTSPVIYANGTTTVTSYETITVACSQVAAQQGPVILRPGESFSAYVLLNRTTLSALNEIGAGAGYTIGGAADQNYWISVNFQT